MDALDSLREQPTIETLVEPSSNHWIGMMGTNVIHDDENSATLKIGNIFISELIIE